jgi:hypothetical protein
LRLDDKRGITTIFGYGITFGRFHEKNKSTNVILLYFAQMFHQSRAGCAPDRWKEESLDKMRRLVCDMAAVPRSGLPALLVVLVVVLVAITAAAVSSESLIRGVAPIDQGRYKLDVLWCGDARGTSVPSSRINDDYCDCVESGVDEPGTSACSNGRFYCNNAGFRGAFIHSSFVDDGICGMECLPH